tara:strand:- start:1444 stop:2556 length:1113 start_codon:yes stop_codon:yes gene_type:complete
LHNDIVNTVIAVQRTGIGATDDHGLRPGLNKQEVLIVNNTGATLFRHDCAGLSGPAIDPNGAALGDAQADEFVDNPYVFNAEEVKAKHWDGNWCLAMERIEVGGTGRALVNGITACIVRCQNANAAMYEYADLQMLANVPPSGEGGDALVGSKLEMRGSGRARVLWVDDVELAAYPGYRWAVLNIAPDAGHMTFPARLTGESGSPVGVRNSEGVTIKPWRWFYTWSTAHSLSKDETATTDWQWRAASESNVNGLLSINRPASEEGTWPSHDTHYAVNRYESHLNDLFSQGGGIEGYVGADKCGVPGALENCPPAWAAVPDLVHVPAGVIVQMRAERSAYGHTLWSFDAMTPVQFTRQLVPQPSAEGGDGY